MICKQCAAAADASDMLPDDSYFEHEECRGGTWCDCQHRPPPSRRHVVTLSDLPEVA